MVKKVDLIPYEPRMGAGFVPYEAVEDQLYGTPITTGSPEQDKDEGIPDPAQPE